MAALMAASVVGCGGKKEANAPQKPTVQASQPVQQVTGLGVSILQFDGRYTQFKDELNQVFKNAGLQLGDFSATHKLNKETHTSSACASERLCVMVKTAEDNETVTEVGAIAQGDGTPASGVMVMAFMTAVASAAIPEVNSVKDIGKTIGDLIGKTMKAKDKTGTATFKGYDLKLVVSKEIGAMLAISKK